jgi:cytochrome c553
MKKTVMIAVALFGLGAMVSVSAVDAHAIWAKDCAKCHGKDGTGNTKIGHILHIRDYTDAKVQASLKEDEMIKTIKEGKKEGGRTRMKPFGDKLSEAEIKAMVAYVKGLKK